MGLLLLPMAEIEAYDKEKQKNNLMTDGLTFYNTVTKKYFYYEQ